MRDNSFLENLLYDIWEEYFSDVPRQNLVRIRFGKHAKRQLGCIVLLKDDRSVERFIGERDDIDVRSVSEIRITRYFAYDNVPEFVIKSTIAHELCHYTHGFNSPLKQLYNKPHQGGVVNREMRERGLGEVLDNAQGWLKENWLDVIS